MNDNEYKVATWIIGGIVIAMWPICGALRAYFKYKAKKCQYEDEPDQE